MDKKEQQDLFYDDFDKPRVFRCLGGAFIGNFNRHATDGEETIWRLSTYLPSEEVAQTALSAGVWPPAEPDAP